MRHAARGARGTSTSNAPLRCAHRQGLKVTLALAFRFRLRCAVDKASAIDRRRYRTCSKRNQLISQSVSQSVTSQSVRLADNRTLLVAHLSPTASD